MSDSAPKEIRIIRLKDGTPVQIKTGQWVYDSHKAEQVWRPYTDQQIKARIAEAEKEHQAEIDQATVDNGGDAAKARKTVQVKTAADNAKSAKTSGVDNQAGNISDYSQFKSNPNASTNKNDPFGAIAGESGIDSHIFDATKPIVTSHNQDTGAPLSNLPGAFMLERGAYQTKTGDELLRGLYQMSQDDPTKFRALQQKMVDAGLIKSVTGLVDDTTLSAYQTVLRHAQLYQSAHPVNPMTPDEILDGLAKAGREKADKKVTETSTSITDPLRARQTIESAMTDKLGRKPTDQEVLAFTQALNDYERQNPTVSTYTTDANGLETSRNTVGKSVDPATYALQYIEDAHGPEQQAVNHLSWYNVAMQALANGPVNTGLST